MPKHDWKVNYAYQKAVSYSQYSTYAQCPHQWYLTYVKKHRIFKPSVHLVFGTSFHETLQEYLRIMFEQSNKAANSLDFSNFLKERMYENYKQAIEDNGGEKFIEKAEFEDFVNDGVSILEWIREHRAKYFNLKTTKLVGIEIPMEQYIVDDIPNVIMIGSIDLIFYNKNTDSYEIYDIKTSTKGWNEDDKKDKLKISQLLLYKHFYSKGMKVSPDKVNVKFFIVKRKPYVNPDFPTKLVQEFEPAQGSRKMKEALGDLEAFVRDCFTTDAKYIDKEYPKNFDSCRYCPFKDNDELCPKK